MVCGHRCSCRLSCIMQLVLSGGAAAAKVLLLLLVSSTG
jgi:hypothetical protein